MPATTRTPVAQQRGRLGAVSAAHPLAAAAGTDVLRQGGNAVDAVVAASAVVCVLMPEAASLGGDLLALVRRPDGTTVAVNGTGASALEATPGLWLTGGGSVTTPGLVAAWAAMHGSAGRLPLGAVLAPALGLARDGVALTQSLSVAVTAQRARLLTGGAQAWDLVHRRVGERWRQPELADLLQAVGDDGPDAFYRGPAAVAVAGAVRRNGGWLDEADLAAHTTDVRQPVTVRWGGAAVHVQPPMTQGVLLAMALHELESVWLGTAEQPADDDALAHLLVELTEAVFAHRSDCGRGAELLSEPLPVDPERAAHRGGPRAYLHTAGVAAADADGLVVSSLVSVFDDFGSAVYVPELGLTLNNRAAGFTDGANAPGRGRKPVHTLAPALVEGRTVLALATPGADGQVQTLLQILVALRQGPLTLSEAVAALRWRTEGGALLLEDGHPALAGLAARGHDVIVRPAGDPVFGGVVGAGVDDDGPFCVSDWRRQVSSAVA